jgi:Ser/Thr protein kinase RdoA (MazF antagonist)
MIAAGWSRVDVEAPRSARLARALRRDPSPLLDALATTPATLVHSDWKAGNLGSRPDGRTVLLDWAFPGQAPACADLAWYLAVTCDRLPEPWDERVLAEATYLSCLS